MTDLSEMEKFEPCGASTRQWGSTGEPCLLHKGHRGHHSIVVYTCDQCGKVRRGHPYQTDPESGIGVCFLCALPPRKDKWYGE